MRYFFIISLVFFASSACSEKKSIDEEIVSSKAQEAHPNKTLTLEVEGMMCIKGCGSAIRKDLYATDAVGDISFSENETNENYTAIIEFDDRLISVEDLKNVISTTNNNQFTIISSETNEFSKQEKSTTKDKTKSLDSKKIETSYESLSTPNIFDIFTGFFLK